MNSFSQKIVWLIFASGLLYAQTRPSKMTERQEKLPTAAAILDHYIEVTGGLATYRKCSFETIDTTATAKNGRSINVTSFRARDGRSQTLIEDGPSLRQHGVTNGVAWTFSETAGAHVLTGKAAERALISSQSFEDDTWREQFPHVALAGEELVNDRKCYHLNLARTDGSPEERFYEVQTGLLLRKISIGIDELGNSQPVTLDIEDYDTSLGLKHPAAIRMRRGGQSLQIHVDSFTCMERPPAGAFVIPHDVMRLIAGSRGGTSLPNPVDLMDKFIEATGGKTAYQSVKTQSVKADVTFQGAGLKGQVVTYSAAGGKRYSAFDLAGAGEFESGSDGNTAWERSAILGPRLVPNSEASGGMTGPGPDEVLTWTNAFQSIETVSQDQVNGAPCYLVKLTGKKPGAKASTMCFDNQTGLLTKISTTVKTQMGEVPLDCKLSDYRADGPIKSAHHVETTVSGQPVLIDVTEVIIDGSVPDGVFKLPDDVSALKASKSVAGAAEKEAPGRPILRRRPD